MATPGVSHNTRATIPYAYLKVKGVSKPSDNVNMVYGESLPVIVVLFPVGVSSKVQPLTELA